MKQLATCHKCKATIPSRQFMKAGWLKAVMHYTDGNKWTSYTCKACRAAEPAALPANPKEAA